MSNFNLTKYLAEGKLLKEENSTIYAVILKEVDCWTNEQRYEDMYSLSVGEIDEDEDIEDEWDIDLVADNKEHSKYMSKVMEDAEDDDDDEFSWETNGIIEILSTHKDRESAEAARESLIGVEYF